MSQGCKLTDSRCKTAGVAQGEGEERGGGGDRGIIQSYEGGGDVGGLLTIARGDQRVLGI